VQLLRFIQAVAASFAELMSKIYVIKSGINISGSIETILSHIFSKRFQSLVPAKSFYKTG
jgi:hypothetical protein